MITSMVGYTLTFNTLDNIRNPTSGIVVEFKQDFAGVGGDVNFIRSSIESRSYYEVFADVVAVLRLQGGHIASWGGKELRMLDHFQMGPNLVRGFAPAGIGPRDMTLGGNQDPLGGTMFWGASIEAQTPFSFLPRDVGIKGAVFADAGSLWIYKGPTFWDVTGETITPGGDNMVAARLGRRRHDLEFAVRTDALRLRLPARQVVRNQRRRRQGLRPGAAVPVWRRHAILGVFVGWRGLPRRVPWQCPGCRASATSRRVSGPDCPRRARHDRKWDRFRKIGSSKRSRPVQLDDRRHALRGSLTGPRGASDGVRLHWAPHRGRGRTMSGEKLDAIGIREILAALPHRYPFLLVDRIIDIRGDEHGIGIKNVTINEPHFVGHFPDNPVMPGVLVLEGMAQTAGTLCIRSLPRSGPSRHWFTF